MMRENFMRCTFAAFHGAPSRMKFYAANAGELYATIRQLNEMRAGLDAAISGLEQAMEKFSEAEGGEPHRKTIHPVDRE